jgi:hypothetical protein
VYITQEISRIIGNNKKIHSDVIVLGFSNQRSKKGWILRARVTGK